MKEKEIVLSYLIPARTSWLLARDDAERAEFMDIRLNSIEAETMGTIDDLLEELHTLGRLAMIEP